MNRSISISLIFFGFSLVTSLWFLITNSQFSDDQITYLVQSRAASSNEIGWIRVNGLSSILSYLDQVIELSPKLKFISIYFFISVIYLFSMHYGLGRWLPDHRIRCLVALISTTPFYVLGMTHWGFAEFELIRGRIFSTVFAPVAIRIFYDHLSSWRSIFAYLLIAVGSLFSLAIIFLLPIFLITAIGSLFGTNIRRWLKNLIPHLIGFVGVLFLVSKTFKFGTGLGREMFSPVSAKFISSADRSVLSTDATYLIDFLWEINYFGFWWAMFPPKLMDIWYSLLGGLPFFLIAGFAIFYRHIYLSKRIRELGWFVIAALCTAYGYQFTVFVGWKVIDLAPSHFEEVRAFKYILFPVFILIGVVLSHFYESKRYWITTILVTLLLLTPYRSLKLIPESVANGAYSISQIIIDDPIKQEYVKKALNLKTGEPKLESELNSLLEVLIARKPARSEILSDENFLRLYGFTPTATYQSKIAVNAGKFPNVFNDEDHNDIRAVIAWYISYHDTQTVIYGSDPERLIDIMRSQDTAFAITRSIYQHKSLRPLFSGSSFFLYELTD
ncbi:hypothetical protein OAR43_07555 [Gammaproteobacteria bacterium]|nr:hypothetical protein [Gammaproteobacteria bacterium]MDC3279265.1 hypothetical protein [Gammaproteobacteria bacterium]